MIFEKLDYFLKRFQLSYFFGEIKLDNQVSLRKNENRLCELTHKVITTEY